MSMQSLLQAKWVRYNHIATIFGIFTTILLSYFVWVREGCDPWLPFISDTDVNPQSGIPFTIGLSISGIMLTIAFIQIGKLRQNWLEKYDTGGRLIFWNKMSTLAGVTSGLATSWIAFTPWHEQMILHIFQASIIFTGAAIWVVIASFVSIKMSEIDESFSLILKNRIITAAISVSSFILMSIHFGLVVSGEGNLSNVESYLDSVVICTELASPILTRAAFFEWLMVFSLGAVLASFIPEIDLLVDEN
jgi:hypothetical protein|tara:strand:- start:24 stop:767 length:744 start_codon:yes stop_codon:yes gene_type:complete